MISSYSISEKSLSTLPSGVSSATPNPFNNLLKGSNIQIGYLIELEPFDDTVETIAAGTAISVNALSTKPVFTKLGGTNVIYLSNLGFFTKPTDNPANTTYIPLVNNPFQFDVSILNGRQFRGGLPAFGAIRIKAGDTSLDGLASMFWSGRTVTIYAGGVDFERSEYDAVFKGVVRDIEYDEDEIIINISDKSNILETSFNQSLYAGTGGVEGGDDIKGDVKPLCYGQARNVPLKLIDPGTNLYQVHDGAMEEVTAVYDRGVALTNAGDVADITAASVSGGTFKTQLSGGYIRLGGNPDGRVTADIKGDNTDGYIDKTGAIISRLVSKKLGEQNFTTDDIDQGSLNALDASIPDAVGVFVNSKTQLNRILDDLTNSLNVYWIFTRQGQISAGIIDSPSNPILTIDENTIIDDTFEAIEVIPPAWRVSAGYQRNWQIQNPDNIAAAATSAQKTFVIEQYRNLIVEDRNTRTKTKNGFEIEFNSLLVNEVDAQDYLDRLVRIYQTQRKVYRIKVIDLLFRVFVGDVIKLQYPRYGLESGKNFIITAIGEDAEDGTTELELWG